MPAQRSAILVVDDNPDNLRVAVDVLESGGFTVRTARDGETGIRRAKLTAPDLILLDIQMPGIDGYETCRRLKQDPETAAIPVVVMTALLGTEDKLKAFGAGAVDYITKPFQLEELRARIETHLALAQLQEELRAQNAVLEEQVAERTAAIRATNEALARFVPNAFLASLGHEDILGVRLGDHVHGEYTVMFSDMRDSTRLSEELGPEAMFAVLTEFFERTGPCISAHGGHICEFRGDGVLAVFSSPEAAVESAIEQHHVIDRLNGERRQQGVQDIRMGIGLNTGPLTLGVIGDGSRLNTTVIGDTVNLAARMEGFTKSFGVRVAVSGTTREGLGGEYALRFLDRVVARGKTEQTDVFEVLAADHADKRAQKATVLEVFEVGQRACEEGDYAKAVGALAAVLERLPGDMTTRHWMERAARLLLRS